MKVIKRNGTEVNFDMEKIYRAIANAMEDAGEYHANNLIQAILIAKEIQDIVEEGGVAVTVEEIQDMVERTLMAKNLFDVARKYIIYRDQRTKERDKIWEMTDLQRDIYEKKYRHNEESFSEFLDRVSGGNTYIRKLIQKKKFLPAGRILANRGLNEIGKKVCYSNCFVNKPPEDNLESIFEVAGQMARTYSYGGGCGITLENLRPRDAKVNNSANKTTGAVSFMDLYSTTTGLIGQNARRGALMLSLPVEHPDIEEFIDAKKDLTKINFANTSVMVSDAFMEAVRDDLDWEMRFEVKDTGEVITKTVSARKLFRKLAQNNWEQAEPGILFWDTVQDYNINSGIDAFKLSSTNPCGEVPLPEGGSCLLSSINLSEYVLNPFSDLSEIDFKSLNADIPEIVRFMDDLVEEGVNYLPLEHQKECAVNYRQIGIGVMGLSDMLIKLGLTYGSESSILVVMRLMDTIANAVLNSSALLAKERGTYPAYNPASVDSEYLQNVANPCTLENIKKYGLRNAQLLSIAPTGSISTLWGVSGGIEPIFALSHNRRSESLGDGEDVVYKVHASIVTEYMNATGKTEKNLPEYFITSHEINYRDRVRFQGAIQYYVDNAISSTVNLPNSATVEDIEDLYMLAWDCGLKGITVYRDGCFREGILTATPTDTKPRVEDGVDCKT